MKWNSPPIPALYSHRKAPYWLSFVNVKEYATDPGDREEISRGNVEGKNYSSPEKEENVKKKSR